jgi:hypothetical protein
MGWREKLAGGAVAASVLAGGCSKEPPSGYEINIATTIANEKERVVTKAVSELLAGKVTDAVRKGVYALNEKDAELKKQITAESAEQIAAVIATLSGAKESALSPKEAVLVRNAVSDQLHLLAKTVTNAAVAPEDGVYAEVSLLRAIFDGDEGKKTEAKRFVLDRLEEVQKGLGTEHRSTPGSSTVTGSSYGHY